MTKTFGIVPAYVEYEMRNDGSAIVTLRHHKHKGQFAKFLINGGGNLIPRAVQAVYNEGSGDADAYFHAQGMADWEAFSDIWSEPKRHRS